MPTNLRQTLETLPCQRIDAVKGTRMKVSLVLMSWLALPLVACADQPQVNQSAPEPARMIEIPQPVGCAGGVPFTLDGFEAQDPMIYIDAPDSDAGRATAPLETAWLAQLARGEILPPVVKRYCKMGATQMVVEMIHPVEDDAVMAVTLRAIYRWVADEAGVGWQIAEVGTQQQCARGRNEDGGLCA